MYSAWNNRNLVGSLNFLLFLKFGLGPAVKREQTQKTVEFSRIEVRERLEEL